MSIEINNESGVTVDEARVLALATHALDYMHIHPDADLAIQFADEHVMEKLHIEFMDEPGPTDVLSFPMDIPRSDEATMLGDIVISPRFAAQQAKAQGHSTNQEIFILAAHGFLHILGYDHARKQDEKEMFSLQRELVEDWQG